MTYTIPSGKYDTDGKKLNLKPGDIINLNPIVKYGSLQFSNLLGTPENPIVIDLGKYEFNVTGKSYGIRTVNCKYFKIVADGAHIFGSNTGLSLDYLSSDFEVEGLEIYNTGFAGIMAKTDPSCNDPKTWRDNFTMRNISIHDNYVHDTGGEGLYVGNTSYCGGLHLECGTKFPHAIEGAKIFNNRVENTGWDGMQLGSCVKDGEVFNNRITNYGTKNKDNQKSGIQVSEQGSIYGNKINKGSGNGIIALAGNKIERNIIRNAGTNGIFTDVRCMTGTFVIKHNAILDSVDNAIDARTLSDIQNNLCTEQIAGKPEWAKNNFVDKELKSILELMT